MPTLNSYLENPAFRKFQSLTEIELVEWREWDREQIAKADEEARELELQDLVDDGDDKPTASRHGMTQTNPDVETWTNGLDLTNNDDDWMGVEDKKKQVRRQEVEEEEEWETQQEEERYQEEESEEIEGDVPQQPQRRSRRKGNTTTRK
eukprot:gene31294-6442_t